MVRFKKRKSMKYKACKIFKISGISFAFEIR